MALNLIPVLISAVNLLRGASTVARIIRIGNRVYKVLGSGDSENHLVPYLDTDKLNRSIKYINGEYKKLGANAPKNILVHMRREYGNLAGDLATITPPFSKGIGASEAAIQRDVNKIFKPLETIPFGEIVTANNYSAAMAYNFRFTNINLMNAVEANNWSLVSDAFGRRGWLPTSEVIDVVSKPTSSLHHAAMGKDGLVRKQFYVTGPKASAKAKIDEYAEEVKRSIGKMAGGWIKCYIGLGGTGKSLPTKYAAMGEGTYKITKGSTTTSVAISNRYGNYNGFMKKKSGIINMMYIKRHNAVLTSIKNDFIKEIKNRRMAA